MSAYLILIIVIGALLVVAGGAFLLAPRARRRPRAAKPGAARTGATQTTEAPPGEAQRAGAGGGGAATIVPEAPPVEGMPPAVVLEKPPPSAGRMVRLRARLARSQSGFGSVLLGLLARDTLDDAVWEQIEDTLIAADMGITPTRQIVDELRTKVKVLGTRGPHEVRELLKAELLGQIGADGDRALRIAHSGDRPAVVLMVGVNGTGKTTTCGKLARSMVGDGRTVLLGAADTFRAAAVDQLQTWGARVGARVVRSEREGADPASVAFQAVRDGIADGVDVVIIDTAGRLHTKTGLMDELGKVKRVIEKQLPVDEVLLVLDATTGQNGLRQARVFAEVVDVTGIVLTKLDGTAKGGIIIAVQRELGVPVKLVGLGEGPDDLAPFEPETFVDAVLSG